MWNMAIPRHPGSNLFNGPPGLRSTRNRTLIPNRKLETTVTVESHRDLQSMSTSIPLGSFTAPEPTVPQILPMIITPGQLSFSLPPGFVPGQTSQKLDEGAPIQMNTQFEDDHFHFSFENEHPFPEAWSPVGSGTPNFQTFNKGAMKPVSFGKGPTDSTPQ